MKHTHISKTEFVPAFLDVNMSDFDLYILKKYLFIPLAGVMYSDPMGPSFAVWDSRMRQVTEYKKRYV